MARTGWKAAKLAMAARPVPPDTGTKPCTARSPGMTAKADMYRANAEMCRHVGHTATGRGDRAEWLDLEETLDH